MKEVIDIAGSLKISVDDCGLISTYHNTETEHKSVCCIKWDDLENLVERHKKEVELLNDYMISARMYVDILTVISKHELYRDVGEKIIGDIYRTIGIGNIDGIQNAINDARQFIVSLMK